MKKRFLFALTASFATGAVVAALMPAKGIMSFAEGCEHDGNHYSAVAATCESAGSKEFWACCVCHEQFTTEPGKGTWQDLGAYAGPALASTHPAYVAPLAHTPGAWQVYDRGDTIGLNATCSECGEGAYDEDVETAEKPVVSTAEWTVEGQATAAYGWAEENGTYTASNQKITNSVAVLKLKVTKAGTIAFDFSIICETGYDYLTVFKNSSISSWTSSSATNTGNGAVWSTKSQGANTGYAGTYSFDVAEGDEVVFAKRADGSGWGKKDGSDYDECKVTLLDKFEYGMATYETNGGTAVNPSITINGKLVHDAPTPTKDGYLFDGWYKTSTLEGDPVTSDTYIGNNPTLYAKWFDENDTHALMGSYKGYAFKVNSASSTINSVLSNYSIDIDFRGGLTWTTSNTTDAFNGTFSSLDENGVGTVDGREVYYFEDDGVIFVRKATANTSNYFWVFVKDSTQTYTTGTVLGATWGNYTLSYRTVMEFPLADGSRKTMYIDNGNNTFNYDVQVVSFNEDAALKDVATAANIGFEVFDSTGTSLKKFGYNGSTFVEPTDDYFGKYENSVTSDECETIYVSGAGKFAYDRGGYMSGANDYKVSGENKLYYASGSDAMEYTVNTETKKFTRAIPTVTITYNLNGKTAELEAASSSYTLVGNTQTVAKAFDSSTGAWLYTSSLAKIKEGTLPEGYVFEGWYLDAEGTRAFAQCHPTEDFTLYAKWAANFTVTCVLNNGSDNTVTEAKEGTTPKLTAPTRDGYMFAGWFTDPELEHAYVPGAITGNITLYAKWVEKPAWVGTYHTYNCYGDNKNWNQNDAVGHTIYFKDDGKITKGTTNTDLGTYTAESTLDANNTLSTGKTKMRIEQSSDGHYFIATGYSASLTDSMPGDLLVGAKLADGETISFVQTTLVRNSAYLVKATITSGGVATDYILYVDCANDVLYTDCALETTRGGVTGDSFESVYADSNYADVILIKKNGSTIASWGKNGSSVKAGDAYAGAYSGTLNGAAATVTLNGFGVATIGENSGTYSVSGGNVVVVVEGVTYTITLEGATFTQVLDGFEGTYTGSAGDLVVTGWGECTLDGEAGTYVASGNVLKVTVAGNVSFLTVDKTAGTYEAASSTPFSGLTFTGTSKDSYGDDQTVKFMFDDSPVVQGRVQFGGPSFVATFEGEFVDGVLTITLTSDIYSSGIVGKSATFSVADGAITCTSTELTSGMYRIDKNAAFTCPDFVAPVEEEGSPDPEPVVTPLTAGTYTAYVEDMFGDELTYVFTVNADLVSGSIVDVPDDELVNVTITASDDENFQYMTVGDINLYFNVNEDGSLEVTVEEYYNYVSGTFTMTK